MIPMTPGYRLSVTCPICGGPLDHVTASAPKPHVSIDVRAVAKCEACRDTFTIEVTISSNRAHAANRARFAQSIEVHAARARTELQEAR